MVWTLCDRFLNSENKYVSADDLMHVKDDPITLLNMYCLYQMFHLSSQLIKLGTVSRQLYNAQRIGLPVSLLDEGSQNIQEDGKDYTEADFADLWSVKRKQESINVFYDRLKELLSPIDISRLSFDTVA